MSIDVMSAVWKLKDLADSEMLILLAMADWADKDGVCWPSIAQLAEKTNKGERTIQGAIKSIVAKGHLTRTENPGRGCMYVVHPRSRCAPAEPAPPQGSAETPAAAAPNTLDTPSSQKATPSSKARAKSGTFVSPDFWPVVSPDGATAKAMAAWPPGRIAEVVEHFVDHHTAKQTVSADWQASFRTWVKLDKRYGNRQPANCNASSGSRTRAAALSFLDIGTCETPGPEAQALRRIGAG